MIFGSVLERGEEKNEIKIIREKESVNKLGEMGG